jgi:3-deoxy-7-phosphoheptulonate synthase
MAKAAIAAGTDSLMIEVHPNPAKALSDGPQSLTPGDFVELMQEITPLAQFFGRETKLAFTNATPFADKAPLNVGV